MDNVCPADVEAAFLSEEDAGASLFCGEQIQNMVFLEGHLGLGIYFLMEGQDRVISFQTPQAFLLREPPLPFLSLGCRNSKAY